MAHSTKKNNRGEKVPSVTQIIDKNLGWNKDALCGWTRKLALAGIDPNKVAKEACDNGTLCHKYIECYANGDPLNKELEELKTKATFEQVIIAERALEEFKQLEKELELTNPETEIEGVDEENQFSYVIDYIASSKHGLCLLDWKTAKGIFPDHIIQISAYHHVSKRYKDIKYTALVHIRKDFDTYNSEEGDKIITLYPIDDNTLEMGWNLFLELRKIHDKKQDFEEFIDSLKEGKE